MEEGITAIILLTFCTVNIETLKFTNLDRSGLKTSFLSPQELELFELANSLSQTKLEKFEFHHRVKRGKAGYVALPLPTLPHGIDKTQARLFTRPNRRLIALANQLSINRQGVLPPSENTPDTPFNPQIEDPFYFKPNTQRYPNSIQDVLHAMDEDPEYNPNYYPDILTPTKKPQKPPKPTKKKKIVYKVVGTKKPEVHEGTTKRIVYKIATKPPTKPPKTVEKSTKKPEIIYHTRKPITEDINYDHTTTVPPFPKTTPVPHKPKITKKKQPTKPDDYMAVIPYKDVFNLFQMLNKHTNNPTSKVGKKSNKKKNKPTRAPLPPPTTKRTPQLQTKVIKRTPLKGKKKKRKKVVHVSF